MRLSVVIPALNEAGCIERTLLELGRTLNQHKIPYEIIVVDDCSQDNTLEIVKTLNRIHPEIVPLSRSGARGFGRAIRFGLRHCTGEVVTFVMADGSDDPSDVARCYQTLVQNNHDCIFGSRFMSESKISDYPRFKLFCNRIVNGVIKVLFHCPFNDMTNAFKMYRSSVIKRAMPLRASHFNISLELSLSAFIRGCQIATIPINWSGRKSGHSNFKLLQMGRRYLAIVLIKWIERKLILDDILVDDNLESL